MNTRIPASSAVGVRHVGEHLTFHLTEPAAPLLTVHDLQTLADEVGDAVQAFIGRTLGREDREAGAVEPFTIAMGLGLVLAIAGALTVVSLPVLGLLLMAGAPLSLIGAVVVVVVAEGRAVRVPLPRRRPEVEADVESVESAEEVA